MRRVWGDHTMAGARGFYNPRSEDHATVALFQTFAVFRSPSWADEVLARLGVATERVLRVRFAYACEERLDDRLLSKHGRDFVIPDIMLLYENEAGLGLLAFEVKKPGGQRPTVQELTKAETYADLPSTRGIPARNCCFLVDDRHVAALRQEGQRALGWSELHSIQQNALDRENIGGATRNVLKAHLAGHFAAFGVGDAPQSPALDLMREFARARSLRLPPAFEALACGFTICATRRAGRPITAAPYTWLRDEPDIQTLRTARRQSRHERRVNRWSFDWSSAREPRWSLP